MRRAVPTNEWYKPQSGDITWRRHIIVLLPSLVLPTLYGVMGWMVLAFGSYLSGALSRDVALILLFVGMVPTTIWHLYHVEDWKDEMYVLSVRQKALIHQMRHPFALETGSRLPFEFITFTRAQLGLKTEDGKKKFSFSGFFRWLFGCGDVTVYGPSARVVQVLADVFNPAGIKSVIDSALEKHGQ